MSALDPITILHNAIVALLLPYFPARNWQIEPVPAPLSLNEFKALTGRTPWIGVSWVEYAPQAGSTRSLNGDQRMRLTVCVKHSKRAERFFGDRVGPGLYPSLSTAATALHGRRIEDVGSLLVTRIAQTFADGYADDTIAIGIVDVSCNTSLGDWQGEAADAPDFARLVSSFEVIAPDGSTRPAGTTDTTNPGDA